MSTEQAKALANRVVKAINRRDVSALDEVIAPDSIDHQVPPGMPPTWEAAKQGLGVLMTAFPDFHYDVAFTVAEGDLVAQRLIAHGTMTGEFFGFPPTGKRATWTETHMSRIADGKLVEHWANVDQVGMMQQLGLMPGG